MRYIGVYAHSKCFTKSWNFSKTIIKAKSIMKANCYWKASLNAKPSEVKALGERLEKTLPWNLWDEWQIHFSDIYKNHSLFNYLQSLKCLMFQSSSASRSQKHRERCPPMSTVFSSCRGRVFCIMHFKVALLSIVHNY